MRLKCLNEAVFVLVGSPGTTYGASGMRYQPPFIGPQSERGLALSCLRRVQFRGNRLCVPAGEIRFVRGSSCNAGLSPFSLIEINGRRFDHDLVIEEGRVRRRRKGPSKGQRAA